MSILTTPPDWMAGALCAQADPEIFFPDKGGSTTAAMATCARCPVAAECLDYALTNHERFGVWGGTSGRTRRRLEGPLTRQCAQCDTAFETGGNNIYCSTECRRLAKNTYSARYYATHPRTAS